MNENKPRHTAESDRGLTEDQARRSEVELMVGRLAGLARSNGITADQRIGVCLAQKVLEERRRELNARRNATNCDHGYPPANTDDTCPSCGKARVTSPEMTRLESEERGS